MKTTPFGAADLQEDLESSSGHLLDTLRPDPTPEPNPHDPKLRPPRRRKPRTREQQRRATNLKNLRRAEKGIQEVGRQIAVYRRQIAGRLEWNPMVDRYDPREALLSAASRLAELIERRDHWQAEVDRCP